MRVLYSPVPALESFKSLQMKAFRVFSKLDHALSVLDLTMQKTMRICHANLHAPHSGRKAMANCAQDPVDEANCSQTGYVRQRWRWRRCSGVVRRIVRLFVRYGGMQTGNQSGWINAEKNEAIGVDA